MHLGGARVDRAFFSTLQAVPELGRTIQADEDQPGRSRVVVISHALWQSTFGGTPQVLERSLRLNGETYRIIGVMPQAFGYPHETDFSAGASGGGPTTDVWIPLALSPQQRANRDDGAGYMIARLKPGVSVQAAQAEISSIMVRLDQLHGPDLRGWGGRIVPFR